MGCATCPPSPYLVSAPGRVAFKHRIDHADAIPLPCRFSIFKFKDWRKALCYTDRSPHLNEDTIESGKSHLLNVQTLRRFPKEKLHGEIVLVRFDSNLLHGTSDWIRQYSWPAISTVKYLYDLGAKVLLVGDWGKSSGSSTSIKTMSEHLSSVLELNVVSSISSDFQVDMSILDDESIILLQNLNGITQENANSLDFSRRLSNGARIFVNDAFSVSHKVLASTVGVTRFCHASLAGFKFEQELSYLMEVAEITRRPYYAVIGGDSFSDKSKALLHLASKCDGLVFVGRIAHLIMHVSKLPNPSNLGVHGAFNDILDFLQLAKDRKLPIFLPVDFVCAKDLVPEDLDVFPSDKLPNGWSPVGLGPKTMDELSLFLAPCKKILWIGPVKFSDSWKNLSGEVELACILEKLSRNACDVVVVGSAACNAIAKDGEYFPCYKQFLTASPVWEFLKGKPLPGLSALDRTYPFDIVWRSAFANQTQPLMVDIGSGNGLFLLRMAKRWRHLNFLGLEINKKLVNRCLEYIAHSGMQNVHFVATNATHSFRSIVSSYPGELILVSIQCPNPDFKDAQNRWRMVQICLIEAVEDLLINGGKVFLQSDIKDVVTRMKNDFTQHSKTLVVDKSCDQGWIEENPFGIRSDWEQHVLDRGASMYRTILQKTGDCKSTLADALDIVCACSGSTATGRGG